MVDVQTTTQRLKEEDVKVELVTHDGKHEINEICVKQLINAIDSTLLLS